MKQCVILLALLLGGCITDSQPTIVHQNEVVLPPDALYRCPQMKNWPDPKTLTDIQVAKILNTLDADNRVCRESLMAIKKYLESVKGITQKHP